MKVFDMIGEGGKCTTACLRSLLTEEGFRFRIGRGVGGGEEVGVESIAEDEDERRGAGCRGGRRGGGTRVIKGRTFWRGESL
jgi:hypothetical protein